MTLSGISIDWSALQPDRELAPNIVRPLVGNFKVLRLPQALKVFSFNSVIFVALKSAAVIDEQ